jgi:hypothetical protein
MRSAKAVVSEKLARLGASNMSYNTGSGMHASSRPPRTITSLRRWSIINKELPGETLSALYNYLNSSDNCNVSSCFRHSRNPRLRFRQYL